MWLLLAFIAVPLIEIALFIQVGGLIGLGWTLAIVLVTALLGTWLVRSQGALAMGQLRRSFNDLRDPTEPLVHGAMILFAGALLLTPGFFTDAVGFSLLVPQIRHRIYLQIRDRVKMHAMQSGQPGAAGPSSPRGPGRPTRGGDVIEGDYVEIDETPPARGVPPRRSH